MSKTRPRQEAAATATVAGTVLWVALAALAAGRLVSGLVPSMAPWGINVLRFLPSAAWIGWALLAAALIPAVGRALLPPVESAGRAFQRTPLLAGAVAAVIAAALVAAFPDRLRFVGDSLLRLGGVRSDESPVVLSPQAFPLDVLLHYVLPLGAAAGQPGGAELAERWIGALGAAGLAGLSVALATALEVGPAARAAAAATACFGGYLCLFTGEGKAFSEMCLVVVGFAAFALRAARGGSRGAGAVLGAGIALAAGLTLHRLALGLVPAWVLMAALWARRDPRAGARWSALPALLGFAIPLVTLVVMGPRLARTILTYDLGANFATLEARASGGLLAFALAGPHLLDVLDLALFLSPLAIAIPFLAGALRRDPVAGDGARARQEGVVLAILLPFAGLMLLARPPQGLVRDWDSFATAGAALSVAAAWWVARAIDRSGWAWLAPAVVLGVALPAAQWLAHYHDAPRGIARLEAFMLEPPGRPAVDRARTWDFLAWHEFNSGRYDDAARAFEHAVAEAPSPRNLTHWAMAESMARRPAQALELYSRAVERDSTFTLGWIGVAVAAIGVGDLDACERAARRLEVLAPDNPKTREILDVLARNGRALR